MVARNIKILGEVKSVLIGLTEKDIEKASIKTILDMAKVKEEQYYYALRSSTKGIGVVLIRTPQEIYINNYNIEWIKAWNGNMDI